MDTEASVKVSYAKITKRIVAYVVDQLILFLIFDLFFLLVLNKSPYADLFNADLSDAVFSYTAFMSIQDEVLEGLAYIVLEVLMITKLGWTPGRLLCGIYIKDANTLKNVALTQVVIRSTFKVFLWIPSCISEWFLILPILVLIFVVFDQRKQTFYDKIAKTVVTYKPAECHINLNYVGITRRVIAHIIDRFTIMGMSLVCSTLVRIIFHPAKSQLLTIYICSFFSLSIVFGVFMIRRLSGTLGQLLCFACIKDANTLKSPTLMQTTIRCVLFEVISFILSSIFIMNIFSPDEYISKWWFDPLTDLTFTTTILIFIYAIFDQRKQTFYDKIARTVVIDYKP